MQKHSLHNSSRRSVNVSWSYAPKKCGPGPVTNVFISCVACSEQPSIVLSWCSWPCRSPVRTARPLWWRWWRSSFIPSRSVNVRLPPSGKVLFSFASRLPASLPHCLPADMTVGSKVVESRSGGKERRCSIRSPSACSSSHCFVNTINNFFKGTHHDLPFDRPREYPFLIYTRIYLFTGMLSCAQCGPAYLDSAAVPSPPLSSSSFHSVALHPLPS